jgi:hypothetical protein
LKYLFIFSILLLVSSAYAQTPFRDTAGLTLNGIEWCEENYQLYNFMENDFFEHHQHSIESRLCGNLYNDDLWLYSEPDRYKKLIEQSRIYYSLEIQESSLEARDGIIDTKPVNIEEIPQKITQQQKELEQDAIESETIESETIESETNVIEMNSPVEEKQEGDSEGGGCLIATATYGSELAPEVQKLRELRDNSLLQTKSGTNFINSFNDFYYSFSPTIADWERENSLFKEVVKIVITPMITSLSILNYVDMDSEAEVLGYGISLILLNGMMYVGIPASVIVVVRRF